MRTLFATKPEKRENSDNDILLTTFAIHDATCGGTLLKVLWLKVMEYLSESDLNALMLTNHHLRLNAVESIRRRAKMPTVQIGSFFNVRMGFFRILLDQLSDKEVAQTIQEALSDPVFQTKVFNKIPTWLLAEWLGIHPEKVGDFILHLLTNNDPRELKHIFKNVVFYLNILNENNIDVVKTKVSLAVYPPPEVSTGTEINVFF
ncbi:MAG TPA: hypothetical protein VGV92_04430 [Gammaproteobacteria bacterium]|nr:hypothetical protein [Gammaproteobacteria bacterium]